MIQLWITYPQLTIFKNFLSWEISHTYQNRKYEYMNSTYLSSCFNNHSKSYFINNPTINIRFCTPIPTQGLGFQHIQAVLGYQQGVLLFNSVLTLSTQRGHQIPQVKGLVHNTDPTPPPTHTYSLSLQMSVTSSDYHHLCFWLTSYRAEVPTTPTLGSINSLEHSQNLLGLLLKDIT